MRIPVFLATVVSTAWLFGRELEVPRDYSTIQAALDAAADGDTVLVAPGTYSGDGNRDLDFAGKAVTLQSVAGAEATVIDCEGAGRGFAFRSAETYETAVVGLTVRGGLGDVGGAVLCEMASPKLSGCRFVANRALERGGALACTMCSSPRVSDCSFEGNVATSGGAVACVEPGVSLLLEGCRVEGNAAQSDAGGVLGRGRVRIRIVRSALVGNWAGGQGGAIAMVDGGSGQIVDCKITGNAAGRSGGGVSCLGGASPILERCVVSGNHSSGSGGALSCATPTDEPYSLNCLFTGNAARGGGGAAGCLGGASPRFMNCTVADNDPGSGGSISCEAEAAPAFVNTVLWGDAEGALCGLLSACLTDRDPMFRRAGVFDFDRFVEVDLGGIPRLLPDFVVDPGDYRVLDGSPAIDAGTPQAAPEDDLKGDRRPCGRGVDVGAYEACSGGSSRFLRGDANADGGVDVSDAVFLVLYMFSGAEQPPCMESADGDDSGVVDVSDAMFILAYLFQAGREPPAPGALCGDDPTPDALSCDRAPPCG